MALQVEAEWIALPQIQHSWQAMSLVSDVQMEQDHLQLIL
jgi:hypothetical protein